LAAALDVAWQRAVAAREVDGQRQRADAERSVAGALWAAPPALEATHRNDRLQSNAGRRETEIGVVVPLWLPGQRSARADAADAGGAQADAAREAARLRLAGELREAAWGFAAARADMEQADAQRQGLQRLAADVERRVRAGDLARADALVARAESLAADAQVAEAQQRFDAARMRWILLTGVPAEPSLGDIGSTPRPAVAIGSEHPELQLAARMTAHARKRLDVVRSARRDPPELLVGTRRDVAGRTEPSNNSLVVGVRVPFGTDDRNRPLETAALSELEVAQTSEQRVADRLQAELAVARSALQSARAQLDLETARAQLHRERLALIDRSFRAGETALPDLLRAMASAAQADGAVARQRAALGLARARLDQASGVLP
jgi:cobalt-zinc-cadmium efflux system outer membrane protein